MNIKKIKAFLVLFSFLAYMPLGAFADTALKPGDINPGLPTLGGGINQDVTINDGKNGINVIVGGGVAGGVGQSDWNDFNVGAGNNVNWQFTNHSQTSINRVLGGSKSQIMGSLTNNCGTGCNFGSTGKVILINPSGILFGAGSSVNLNSFTATTFDIKGIKNVGDYGSAAELAQFGHSKDITFVDNGNSLGSIDFDNATVHADKSLAIMARDIKVYNGSALSTNLNFNYGNQSFSNLKLITSDGVTFNYEVNGYNKNGSTVVHQGKDGVDYNITLENAFIDSGDVFIKNRGMTNGVDSGITGSNINITNSDIKGYKLVNNAFGDVYIVGNNKVNISDSKISTWNTTNGNQSTVGNHGGAIVIRGGQGVSLARTHINAAAYTTNDTYGADITVDSPFGYVWVDQSILDARGSINVTAKNDAIVVNSKLVARNSPNAPGVFEDINISGKNVKLGNNVIDASKDVNIIATGTDAGDKIFLDRNELIHAGGTLNLLAKDTDIYNSFLSYYNLNFFNATSPVNNVLIRGTSAFENKANPGVLSLVTNGNLDLSGATLKNKTYTVAFHDEDANPSYPNLVPAPVYTVQTDDQATNQSSITLASTGGNVTIKDKSNIKTKTGDFTVNADLGNITVNDSTIASAAKVNLNAAKGNVNIENASTISGVTGINTNSKIASVSNSTLSSTTGDINLVSSVGDININKGTLTANAGNIKLASAAKLNITNGSLLDAGSNLSLFGTSTLLDNSNLTYNTISFFDAAAATPLVNNVTITGTSKITDKSQTGLTLATNGDLTIKDNTIKRIDGTDNASISLTGNNVILTNAIANATTGDLTVTATAGNITTSGANLTTGAGDIKLAAERGSINLKGNSRIASAKDVDIKSLAAFNAKADTSLPGMSGATTISGKNVTITTLGTDSDINMNQTGLANITYDKLTLNAGRDNNLSTTTANTDWSISNVDLNAKRNNTIKTTGNLNLKNTNIKGVSNKINAGKDVNLNNVDLLVATADAKDTITSITAGGSVYTDAKTTSASGSTNEVFDDFQVTGDGTLNTNGTKLLVTAGSNINLVLENANNANAGIITNAVGTTTLNTKDGSALSIARIETGKLNLNKNGKFISATDAVLTADDILGLNDPSSTNPDFNAPGDATGRAYISVRDQDGFNLDSPASEVGPGGIYESSYGRNGAGDGFTKHFIALGGEGANNAEFLLSYNKPFNSPLPPAPPEDVSGGGVDDLTPFLSYLRLPLQAEMLGNPGVILNNLTDPTPGLVAAAAGITLEEDEDGLF